MGVVEFRFLPDPSLHVGDSTTSAGVPRVLREHTEAQPIARIVSVHLRREVVNLQRWDEERIAARIHSGPDSLLPPHSTPPRTAGLRPEKNHRGNAYKKPVLSRNRFILLTGYNP